MVFDVAALAYDEDLARALEVLLVVKGFHQLSIVEKIIARRGDRSQGLTPLENVAARQYSQGVVARLSLGASALTPRDLAAAPWRVDCVEPFDVALHGGDLALTAGSEVRISRPGR